MRVKGIIYEDFVNYKKPCTVIETPICKGFKCGKGLCQNSPLALSPTIEISDDEIIKIYKFSKIPSAICFQGLEPFDTFEEMFNFIKKFRKDYQIYDDIVIYTGYNKNEILQQINQLKEFDNIFIKFGRYLPNQVAHFDKILGVNLISDNQYAERIS